MPVRRVAHHVTKGPVRAQRPEPHLADGVAHGVARIGRPGRRGRRALFQQDAEELRPDGMRRQAQHGRPAPAVVHGPCRECHPSALVVVFVDAGPVLDLELQGEGLGPGDAGGVDDRRRVEAHHDPLRALARLAGVAPVQVGVGLPERRSVAVVEARIAVVIGLVDGVAAPGQPVAPGGQDRRLGRIAGGPVALGVLRVAPGPFIAPVPGLDGELGAQAIGQGLEARLPHPGDVVRREQLIHPARRHAVNPRAQRLVGAEGGGDGREVDGDRGRSWRQRRGRSLAGHAQKQDDESEARPAHSATLHTGLVPSPGQRLLSR